MSHIEKEISSNEMLRTRSDEAQATVRVPGRVVQLASGVDIAARMMRMERVNRPSSMHRIVAEAITIKETSFFRNLLPFHLLADRIIPGLIAKRQQERRLRLWSAGCATGQEAYSLAMLVHDRFPQLVDWDVRIIGTDISRSACDYARRGRYSRSEMNRGLPARTMLRYFEPRGEEWEVCEELRRMVRFECGNLCDPPATGLTISERFDVVFLRNVLLYFSPTECAQALAEVYARMRPHAALLLGASEQMEDASELFELVFDEEQLFYRSVAAG
jgi:chemotaxis protein methyltransferase CheR